MRHDHLYLILDLYTRKIVGFDVHETDDSEHAVNLLRRTALAENLHTLDYKPVLHGDNGSTLKATTVLAMMNWLGLRASYSRPRVSEDNAFVEALLRTAKYRPQFPVKGFADLEQAREWASSTAACRCGPRRPAGSPCALPASQGMSPTALGAAHPKLESDHRRHPQSRARRSGQGGDREPS